MSWLQWTIARALRTVAHDKIERELDEELQSHLEMLIDDYVDHGLSYQEARRRALLRLGNPDAVRDAYLDAASISPIEHFVFDIKLAFKELCASWRFSAQTVAVFALGILVASVMFAIAFCPREVPGYGSNAGDVFVVSVYPRNHLGEWNQFEVSLRPTPAQYDLLRASAHTLETMSAGTQVTVLLQDGGHNLSVAAANVTPEFFPLLGVTASLGRTFGAGDQDRAAVVISDELWRSHFHSDPNILGSELTIDRLPVHVIGVMPRAFSFPARSNFWFEVSLPTAGPQREWRGWDIFARLAPGVSRAQAEAELNEIAGSRDSHQSIRLESLAEVYGGRFVQFAPIVAAASTLLVISWINVAVLMLAHILSRRHEFAVRIALGASRSRIARQVVAQTFLLALAAFCAAAPLAAIIAPRVLSWLSKASLGFPETSSPITSRALIYAGLLACLSAAMCCVAPAAEAVRGLSVSGSALWLGGRRGYERLRRFLVIYQVAFALVLFVGAAEMARTFFVQWFKFDRAHSGKTLLVALTWVNDTEHLSRSQINSIYSDALRKASSISGIQSVAIASQLPFEHHPAIGTEIRVNEAAIAPFRAVLQGVSPSYFEQLSIPLLQGRLLQANDGNGPPVAVVGRSLAVRCFGSGNPVGKNIRVDDANETSSWMTIVGVVGDANISPLSSGPELTLYRPFEQEILTAHQLLPRALILRTTGEAQSQAASIADQLTRMLPALKIYRTQSLGTTLERMHKDDWYTSELLTLLFVTVSVFATLLAAIGVYGLFQYWAMDRRREIAIRLAVGATTSKILLLTMKKSLSFVAAGLILGLPGAVILVESLRKLLMLPLDPFTFFACLGTLATIVLIAIYAPVRAASKCNPMSILRWE